MTWPTALPVAAPRVLRGAMRRRVLQLVLLVGGLFTLGLLCGEQAHAAEGPSAPVAVTAQVTSATSGSPVGDRAVVVVATSTSTSTAGSSMGSGMDDELERASVQVPPPVLPPSRSPRLPISSDLPDLPDLPELSDGAELYDVSGLTELPGLRDVPVLSDLPGLPDLPALAGLPDLPSLPALPALPALPSAPVRTLPVPVVEAPAPGSGVTPVPDGHGLGHRRAADADAGLDTAVVTAMGAGAGAGVATYGPVGMGAGRSADAGHHVASARAGQAPVHAPGPVRRAPAGDPDGVLGGVSVLDGGVSRHGDAHAVTPRHRVSTRLMPGGAVRSDETATRDRRRDIPVFPG
ncbi:hypothetical protein ACFWBB_29060 [Streptomyces sp. NPDC060000]|uniref:hypothetical protein n=1 Tax=Streptomyces sp. NPDC060000 TaxID=3347031 RepID=UPI0036AF7A84